MYTVICDFLRHRWWGQTERSNKHIEYFDKIFETTGTLIVETVDICEITSIDQTIWLSMS